MEATPAWRLEWDESLSVCMPEIDSERRRFIRLVKDLNEAIVDRLDHAELQKRMQWILDDAAEHFAHEKALLKKWHYPDAEEHAMKHAAVIQSLNGIMSRLKHDSAMYEWIVAGLKVKDVLIEHILTEDMKFRDFCRASGDQAKGG